MRRLWSPGSARSVAVRSRPGRGEGESPAGRLEPFPPDDRLDAAAEEALWRVVQAGFRERRKMLHNVLTRQLPIEADRIDAALTAVGIARDRRPQTVAVGEWIALTEALGPIPASR